MLEPLKRILIIGLDGASPHLISRWRESLPNLSRLIGEGASGTLKSVNPPRSIPAWYCFATGMNPAKIGVFGFSQRRPKAYDYTFANMTFCRGPAFWKWLDVHGLKTAVIHMPGTFPPPRVDSAIVSGWPAPKNRGDLIYSFPPELSRQIDTHLDSPFEFLSPLSIHVDNDSEMLKDRVRVTRNHGKTARYVFNKYEWHVGMVVFSELDRASHQFWRHLDPEHPEHNPDDTERFGDALKQVYQACDDEIGKLLEFIGENDCVFVISDHGFGPVRRTFYINEWLRQNGYLKVLDRSMRKGSLIGRLVAPIFYLNQAFPWFRKLAEPFKKKALSNFLRNEFVLQKNHGLVRVNHYPVDWANTVAYAADEGAVHINIRGRDPMGTVEPGKELENCLSQLCSDLKNIQDPETGLPLDIAIIRTEEIYSGKYLDEAPELLISVDDYKTSVMAELGSDRVFGADKRSGTHNLEGVFIAKGPHIREGFETEAGIMDIVPTIFHLMGLPVYESLDGQPITRMFIPDSDPDIRKVQITTFDYSHDAEPQNFDDSDSEAIEERLRDLGYLG